MKKTNFLDKMKTALTNGWGVKVYVNMPELPKPEIICNPHENIQSKIDYYDQAYDEDMKLKTFDQIKITAVEYINIK